VHDQDLSLCLNMYCSTIRWLDPCACRRQTL